MVNILFTIKKKEALRKAYEEAVAQGQDSFTFEGTQYLTEYAKYLLEHLDNNLE